MSADDHTVFGVGEIASAAVMCLVLLAVAAVVAPVLVVAGFFAGDSQ